MNYTHDYEYENGKVKPISITSADSVEALRNDYNELLKKYDPKVVTITRCKAGTGESLHLKVTVNAPTHYLTSDSDTTPKVCSSMSVEIICYPGYPIEQISARYSSNYYLASPNVFRNGDACIGKWITFTSSLLTVVDKLVNDIIHNPTVTRYDSPANAGMINWHKSGVSSGRFPTISPKSLYKPELRSLPPRRNNASASRSSTSPRALPPRRR